MDQEKIRLWRWVAVGVVLLAALITVVWFGRPAYRHFKEHRQQAQAQAFLERGDLRNALLSARQTLQLNPTNVPASRVMAALADRSRSPATLDFLRRIVQTEPSVENKLQLASAALRYQAPPFPLTTQILDDLTPGATNVPGYHVVAASLALSLRRLDDAERFFTIAANLDPTNQLYALNLAVIRLGLTNSTKTIPARATLENLRGDTNLGPAALRSLVVDRLAHRDFAAANNYSTQLLANAKATLADQLQQLGILQQLHRDDFPARLQAIQQTAATNAVAVAEVASWMQGNRLLGESFQWLTNLPPNQQSQSPVRLALADAYLQSADWRGLRDFTTKGNWEEMEFLRLALLSQAWLQLGGEVDWVADDLRGITDFLQATQRVRRASSTGLSRGAGFETETDFEVSPAGTNEVEERELRTRLSYLRGNSRNRELMQRDVDARAQSQLSAAQIIARSSWNSAVREAGNRYSALTTLLGLTERWKLLRDREDLLRRIIEKFPQERWAQQALEPLYLAGGNTAGLNQLYARLLSVFPQDAGVKNNLAYTCLLLKTNLPQACRWAEEVYAGKTNDAVAASTYAFALQSQGRVKDALAVMQKLDARQLQQPDTAFCYAVLLTASGATNEALPFLKTARTKTEWLPQEEALLSAADPSQTQSPQRHK